MVTHYIQPRRQCDPTVAAASTAPLSVAAGWGRNSRIAAAMSRPRSALVARRRIQPPIPAESAATPRTTATDVATTSSAEPCRSTLVPTGLSVNTSGTTNAGSTYFHVSIVVRNGLPPVTAAAANGERAVGGLTSDSTA